MKIKNSQIYTKFYGLRTGRSIRSRKNLGSFLGTMYKRDDSLRYLVDADFNLLGILTDNVDKDFWEDFLDSFIFSKKEMGEKIIPYISRGIEMGFSVYVRRFNFPRLKERYSHNLEIYKNLGGFIPS